MNVINTDSRINSLENTASQFIEFEEVTERRFRTEVCKKALRNGQRPIVVICKCHKLLFVFYSAEHHETSAATAS